MSLLEYRLADSERSILFDTVQDFFAEYDLLISATSAIPAFPKHALNEGTALKADGRQLDPQGGYFLTFVFNDTGHPAASVPAGLTKEGLPVGLQLVGRRFDDDTVLAASAAIERRRPWHEVYGR